jgi:hypothetical protein
MFRALKRIIAAAGVVGLATGATVPIQAAEPGLQPDGTMIVGPAAAKVIGEYLEKVSGRFGALAISRDGQSAAYYICQSRLWKNCDDYNLEDSFISVPSGHLAAKLAERRCRGYASGSGGCVVLFVNNTWKYQFTLAK